MLAELGYLHGATCKFNALVLVEHVWVDVKIVVILHVLIVVQTRALPVAVHAPEDVDLIVPEDAPQVVRVHAKDPVNHAEALVQLALLRAQVGVEIFVTRAAVRIVKLGATRGRELMRFQQELKLAIVQHVHMAHARCHALPTVEETAVRHVVQIVIPVVVLLTTDLLEIQVKFIIHREPFMVPLWFR